jgi:hypothetical protein
MGETKTFTTSTKGKKTAAAAEEGEGYNIITANTQEEHIIYDGNPGELTPPSKRTPVKFKNPNNIYAFVNKGSTKK